MKLTSIFQILFVITAVSVFGYSSACSCEPVNLHNAFCRADAVFRGKVLNETEIFEPPTDFEKELLAQGMKIHTILRVVERVYDIDVHEVFRDTTGELRRGNSIKVSTAGDGAACGVSLSIGAEYYLRAWGSNTNGFGIGLCSGKVGLITTHELDGFKGGYDCECMVDDEWETVKINETHKFCMILPEGYSSVMWLQYGYSLKCIQNYAHCQKNTESGRCMWNVDKTQPECQRTAPPGLPGYKSFE